MTLINSLQKRALLATVVLMLIGSSLYAKGKLTLSGRIVNSDGKKVKKAMVTLLSGGEVVDEEKTGRNGKFKFKKLEEGDYVLQASHDDLGSAEKIVTLTGKEDIGDITLSTEKPSAPIADAKDVSSGDPRASAQPDRISVTVPQTMEEMGSPSKAFILNELNFEIKKLSAEFKHLSQEIDDLKALSKMWVNPLTIYSKEIILKNGSTVFGKIIYQDDKSLKVETLVGYLIVDRAQVVRIVDNVITEDTQEYVPEQIRESYTPPPMPKLAQPRYTSSNNSARNASAKFAANCVFVGNISEKKD